MLVCFPTLHTGLRMRTRIRRSARPHRGRSEDLRPGAPAPSQQQGRWRAPRDGAGFLVCANGASRARRRHNNRGMARASRRRGLFWFARTGQAPRAAPSQQQGRWRGPSDGAVFVCANGAGPARAARMQRSAIRGRDDWPSPHSAALHARYQPARITSDSIGTGRPNRRHLVAQLRHAPPVSAGPD